MHATLTGDKARWVIAGGGAMLVLAGFLWLFRFPPVPAAMNPSLAPAVPVMPKVQIAKSATSDAVLAEELMLRDMRPLFLPTEQFNVTLPEPHREPGKTLMADDTLKLRFNELELDLDKQLPARALLNGKSVHDAKAIDAIGRDSGEIALQGFGRTPVAVPPVRVRGGAIEVVALATGRAVLTAELPVEAKPPGDKPWEPMEMLATVDAAGLIAPLVITSSSRVDEVDAHFRNFLARVYRIGDRLPPGFYRITVGP